MAGPVHPSRHGAQAPGVPEVFWLGHSLGQPPLAPEALSARAGLGCIGVPTLPGRAWVALLGAQRSFEGVPRGSFPGHVHCGAWITSIPPVSPEAAAAEKASPCGLEEPR